MEHAGTADGLTSSCWLLLSWTHASSMAGEVMAVRPVYGTCEGAACT